jgi:hypothetical protein
VRSRSLALQPKKPAGTGGQWRLPSGGTTPGPWHEKQAGEGERPGIQSKKTDLETSQPGRGAALSCLSDGKLRSEAVARQRRPRRATRRRGHRSRSMRASQRNGVVFRLSDKLELGAA